MYALIQNDTVVQIGSLPTRWYDGDRWHDWRSDNPSTDPADYGWVQVVETPRPEDTDEVTHEMSVDLIDGTPTLVWNSREWTEQERRDRSEMAARLDSIEERLEVLWSAMFPPDPVPDEPNADDYPVFSGLWHPGTIIREGDRLWRNIVSVPLTVPPSQLPGHEGHLYSEVVGAQPDEPDVPDAPVWSASATYAVGDLVSYGGQVYRCLVAHGAEYQGTWRPDLAHTVWAAV